MAPLLLIQLEILRLFREIGRGTQSDAPLWHNMNVQIGNKPLDFKPLSLKLIHVIGDLRDGLATRI